MASGNPPNPPGGPNSFPVVTDEDIARIKAANSEYERLQKIKRLLGDDAEKLIAKLEQEEAKLLQNERAARGLTSAYDEFTAQLDATIRSLEREQRELSEKLTKSVQEHAIALEHLRKTEELLNDVSIDRIKAQQELSDQLDDLKLKLSGNVDATEKLIEFEQDLAEISMNNSEVSKEEMEILVKKIKEITGGTISRADAEKLVNNSLIAGADIRQQNLKDIIDTTEKTKEETAAKLALKEAEELGKKSTKDLNESMQGTINKMFGVSGTTNFLTSVVLASTDKQGGAIKGMLSGITESFTNPMKAMNLFFGLLDKFLIKSTFEFDKNLSQINRSLGGMGQEFENVSMTGGEFLRAADTAHLAVYGVGIKELGKSYEALSSKINGFNQLADSQRKLLMENAATMENLGVSANTYATLASNMMGALGKSAEQTNKIIKDLAKDAIAAGRSVSEYTKAFEQVMPKIIGYGREAREIFKELNAFAAMTKGVMSEGDLQSFSDQFNNWDSAAESVSKLNAALGGTSVNIEEMMRADPTEKLMLIKKSFDASGKSFDQMNIGYKRLLAEGFGGDVAKAASFFNGSLEEANKLIGKASASEEELAKRKQKSVEAQEKLAKALESMKLSLTPLINLVAKFAEKLAKFIDWVGPVKLFLFVTLPLGFKVLTSIMGLFGTTMGGMFTSIFSRIGLGITGIGSRIMGLLGPLGLLLGLAFAFSGDKDSDKAKAANQETASPETQNIEGEESSSTVSKQKKFDDRGVPLFRGANITSQNVLIEQDRITGKQSVVGIPDPRDRMTTRIEARTPEEDARKITLSMEPFYKDITQKLETTNNKLTSSTAVEGFKSMSDVSRVASDSRQMIEQNKQFSKEIQTANKEKSISSMQANSEFISSAVKEGIGKIQVNSNVVLPKESIVARLDKGDADRMVERTVNTAVAKSAAAPNKKIFLTDMEEAI